jgi:two-component system, chemotaxis family, chemotaxis protein CheY
MATKILVIDDSLLVRKQVGTALANAGYAVIEAADGAEALEKLQVHADVSLVVCDVNMPRMNGIEFLQRVRPGLPVVMLTTEGQPEIVKRAKELGAKGWILKPFKPDHLLAAAKKLIAAT